MNKSVADAKPFLPQVGIWGETLVPNCISGRARNSVSDAYIDYMNKSVRDPKPFSPQVGIWGETLVPKYSSGQVWFSVSDAFRMLHEQKRQRRKAFFAPSWNLGQAPRPELYFGTGTEQRL
ncbi:hypothetical protein P1X15_22055 [Runella sp. MFBS21]|uniref:hypothetical protein n=1 Tax=Runella sp. MFBS21 TaxID=3034018 RepID=UPI0023F639E7|nr:hypothetical protein [Runella sp. MFBS21]MDF7820321.1 hypothetical protein [Runella sp. MFBS21]